MKAYKWNVEIGQVVEYVDGRRMSGTERYPTAFEEDLLEQIAALEREVAETEQERNAAYVEVSERLSKKESDELRVDLARARDALIDVIQDWYDNGIDGGGNPLPKPEHITKAEQALAGERDE